jgi:hypothetical protein
MRLSMNTAVTCASSLYPPVPWSFTQTIPEFGGKAPARKDDLRFQQAGFWQLVDTLRGHASGGGNGQ